MNIIILDDEIWWIAHNGVDVFHTGTAQAGQEVATGQPFLETFATEVAFNTRAAELGIDLEPGQ